MFRILSSFALSVLVVLAAQAQLADKSEIKPAQHVTTFIEANVIKRVEPKYPMSSAKNGHEGWVVVSYVIEPDGKTSNAIIEASSGGKGFEREALKAIRKWRYTPATEDGQAIQQCQNSVQIDFKMGLSTNNDVSKRFMRFYQKAKKDLEDNKLDDVKAALSELGERSLVTHAEHRFLNYIKLDLARATNNLDLEYKSLTNILKFSDFYNYRRKLNDAEHKTVIRDPKSEKLYSSILGRKLVIELTQNKINQALLSTDNLLLLDHDDEIHIRYQQQRQKIIDFIESNKVLVTDASIETRDFWQYRLVRNNFSFDQINGQLHKLDIRCNNKRHVYTINDQSTWKIPKSWQKCQLFVYGDNNTTFKLIEHGNQKTTDEQVGHSSISG
ncbi:energy transducer TonB [Endozoicomonas sp. G2_1]|uniref:energy transducer TonB n=1 Tax=Endozoicomonas sp. G2_1 TaxID=2821091 RepID=UPI001ADC3DEF|nr:energy transducer TonB [Endozoicomonas sp. G2_1]MBO9491366.1 energy transducer TonB [Endozoicomonas sp. G2_1]